MKWPTKKYNVIYADPPWNFRSWSKKGEKKSAQNHYNCMSIDDICRLPVNDIAADNSILFMWVTDPLLKQQMDVITAWGFEYKTVGFTWVKLNKSGPGLFMGCGYYSRKNPEMCLIGTKGKPGRPIARNVRQVVLSPVREHSRKPDEVYNRIELMYNGPYIELFARSSKPGWDAWGNEVGKFETEGLNKFIS